MIRITINWDFISPVLRVISGILLIEDVDISYNRPLKTILCCKIKKEQGSFGYNSIDDKGFSTVLLDLFKEKIETMVHGYFAGMNLEESPFSWVEDSFGPPFDDYLKQKGITKTKIDRNVIYTKQESDGLKNKYYKGE